MSKDTVAEGALELIENLRVAHDKYRDGEDAGRDGAIYALNSVVEHLLRLETIRSENLAAPLLAISLALNDADDGIPSPITEVKRRVGRKPDSSSRQGVRAMAALTLDLLMKTELPQTDAAKQVAHCMNDCGVTLHGGGGLRISAETVIAWRDNFSANLGKGVAAELYEELRANIAFASDANPKDLRRDLIKRLRRILEEFRASDEKPIQYPK